MVSRRDHGIGVRDEVSALDVAPRRADIQGLRAVAVLLVVCFHAGIGPQAGFLGVDVFFVISGFVIGRRLIEESERSGSIRLRSFYARRVRRLLPAMAVFTVVTAVGTALLLSPYGQQQFAFGTAAAATLFLANVQLYRNTGYFDGSVETNPFLHTWSLSVEEQFYLLLPLLLAGVWYWSRRRSRTHSQRRSEQGVAPRSPVLLLVGGLAATSFVLSWVLSSGAVTFGLQAPGRLAFFSAPTRVWQFCAGVLVALWAPRLARMAPGVASVSGVLGLGAILVAAVSLEVLAPHPAGWATVTVAGTSLLLAAGGRGPVSGWFLSSTPMRWIGDRSYSWYLWHWPVIVYAGLLWPEDTTALVVAAGASLVPAMLSYRFVEGPIRLGAWWTGRRTVALAAACLMVPLVVIGGLNHGASTGWGLEQPSGWYDYPSTFGTMCHLINRDGRNDFDLEQCTFGPVGAEGSVVLLGDELANSVGPAVVAAAAANGLLTVQWSREGCPFVRDAPGPHYRRCEEWQRLAMDLIDEVEPDVVIVANQSLDPSQRAALGATFADLEERAARVLTVSPIPDFGDRFPRNRISVVNPEPSMPELLRSEVETQRGAEVDALREALAAHPSVAMLDPVTSLCDDRCRPVRADEWQYLAPRQLSRGGAMRLEPELRSLITRELGE